MAIKFKVGDRVISRGIIDRYTGTVSKVEKKYIQIKRDDHQGMYLIFPFLAWDCLIVGNKVATACKKWDGKSFLEPLKIKTNKMKRLNKKEKEAYRIVQSIRGTHSAKKRGKKGLSKAGKKGAKVRWAKKLSTVK